MKKIGIITFHTALNYGVYLQAFALHEQIKKLGYEVEIVDYCKRTDIIDGKKNSFKIIFSKLKRLRYIKRYLIMNKVKSSKQFLLKKKSFHEFSEIYLKKTKYCDNYDEVKAECIKFDACVCGSDQIWNPYYTKGNPVYFLEFIEPKKRIAYAPSIGTEDIPETYRAAFQRAITNFGSLSVRETTASQLIEKYTERYAKVVVDPTLLFSMKEWNKHASLVKFDFPYILIYFLGNSELHKQIINQLNSRITNLKIVNLPSTYETYKEKNFIQEFASIQEFLSLVKNAEMVITDSFHGVAFSVNFRKNFYAISRNDTEHCLNSRIEDFLTRIQLKNRIISSNPIDFSCSEIDYTKSEMLLESWITESSDYLEEALKKAIL